jgi:hypothetical protein
MGSSPARCSNASTDALEFHPYTTPFSACCSCPNSASHRNPPSGIRQCRLQILTFQSVHLQGADHLASFGVTPIWPLSEKFSYPIYLTQTLQPSCEILLPQNILVNDYYAVNPTRKVTAVYKTPPSRATRMQHGALIRRRILTSRAFDTKPSSELLQAVVS